MKQNNKFTIYDMCAIGIFTAIIAILAQISIPLPSGVPITLQSFAVTLTAIVLGSRKGAIATIIYLLLGIVGVPVFTHLRGGLHALASPTGGFLISFPLMALCIGIGTDEKARKGRYPLMLILGNLINYAFGLLVYCLTANVSAIPGFIACVLPFIPAAIISAALATLLGFKLRERLLTLL